MIDTKWRIHHPAIRTCTIISWTVHIVYHTNGKHRIWSLQNTDHSPLEKSWSMKFRILTSEFPVNKICQSLSLSLSISMYYNLYYISTRTLSTYLVHVLCTYTRTCILKRFSVLICALCIQNPVFVSNKRTACTQTWLRTVKMKRYLSSQGSVLLLNYCQILQTNVFLESFNLWWVGKQSLLLHCFTSSLQFFLIICNPPTDSYQLTDISSI